MANKVESDAPKTGVDRWRESTGQSSQSAKKRGAAPQAKRSFRGIAFAAALCVAGIACAAAFFGTLSVGVDLQGGTELTYTAADGAESSQMDEVVSILEKRLEDLGAVSYAVESQDATTVKVTVPATDDAEALAAAIGKTGKFELARVDDIGDAEALAKIQNGTEGVELEEGSYTAFLDGSHVSSASVSYSSSSASTSGLTYAVNITFDSEGADKFAEVTKELAESNGQIAVIVDGVVETAPSVSSEIAGGQVSISGGFTLDEATQLKSSLDSGTLPVALAYEGSATRGALLGDHTYTKLMIAVLGGIAVVALASAVVFRGSALLVAAAPSATLGMGVGLLSLASYSNVFVLTRWSFVAIVFEVLCSALGVISLLDSWRKKIREGKTPKNAAILVADSAVKPAVIELCVFFALAAAYILAAGALGGAPGEIGITVLLLGGCVGVATVLVAAPGLRLIGRGPARRNPGAWGAGASPARRDSAGGSDGDSDEDVR